MLIFHYTLHSFRLKRISGLTCHRNFCVFLICRETDGGDGVFIAGLCESVEALTVLRGNFHFLSVYASLGSGPVQASDRAQRDEVISQREKKRQKISWVSRTCRQGCCKANMVLIDCHSSKEIVFTEVLSRWRRPPPHSWHILPAQLNNVGKYVRIWFIYFSLFPAISAVLGAKFLKSRLSANGKNPPLLRLIWSDMWTF